MKVWQIREIPLSTYKTFDDNLKLKMISQQFAFPIEHFDEVRLWLVENMKHPYLIDQLETLQKKQSVHVWVQFTKEEDAVAFKLRWG